MYHHSFSAAYLSWTAEVTSYIPRTWFHQLSNVLDPNTFSTWGKVISHYRHLSNRDYKELLTAVESESKLYIKRDFETKETHSKHVLWNTKTCRRFPKTKGWTSYTRRAYPRFKEKYNLRRSLEQIYLYNNERSWEKVLVLNIQQIKHLKEQTEILRFKCV